MEYFSNRFSIISRVDYLDFYFKEELMLFHRRKFSEGEMLCICSLSSGRLAMVLPGMAQETLNDPDCSLSLGDVIPRASLLHWTPVLDLCVDGPAYETCQIILCRQHGSSTFFQDKLPFSRKSELCFPASFCGPDYNSGSTLRKWCCVHHGCIQR